MRLCLYNGSKKKKATSKKPKKNSSPPKPVAKRANNATARKEPAKYKKTDRKKKSSEPVEVALDPPALLTKLTSVQCKATNEAISFWKYVDGYTCAITKEDMSSLNNLTEMYSKENYPSINLMPSNHNSLNSFSALDIPENWVDRIVGALVDPDLFDDPGDPEVKRLKLSDPVDFGVFNDRSNFPAYLNLGDVGSEEGEEEEVVNCDNKPNQDECDEISDEILKCQEELRLLCRHNEATLTRLSSRAQRSLETENLKHSLELCENEIVKLAQQKHKEQRLNKETLTSSTRGRGNEEESLLIQRCQSLLSALEASPI